MSVAAVLALLAELSPLVEALAAAIQAGASKAAILAAIKKEEIAAADAAMLAALGK